MKYFEIYTLLYSGTTQGFNIQEVAKLLFA